MLGLPSPGATPNGLADAVDWKSLDCHRDEDQVQLDVNRSFIFYPNGMRPPLGPTGGQAGRRAAMASSTSSARDQR